MSDLLAEWSAEKEKMHKGNFNPTQKSESLLAVQQQKNQLPSQQQTIWQ